MTEPDFSAKTLLVTGACGVTSRTIVRALRASPRFARTRLVGCDVCDNPYALYEGLYARLYRVPRLADAEGYRSLVGQICRDERIDAAIVVPEPEVLFWAASAQAMPVPALLPPPRFAQLAIGKAAVYAALADTDLVPRHAIVEAAALRGGAWPAGFDGQLWLRDVSEGSTSGKGAMRVDAPAQAAAWATLNPDTARFMVSAYLPGRNLACLLLYSQGALVKIGAYERLEYFMARTAPSGITGNICKGRLINDAAAVAVSTEAVARLCALSGETMNGLVTVDLRCDAFDRPRITEINLRQVAAASAFAEVPGANLAEAQALATFGRADLAGPREATVQPRNRLFRDIDGRPVFVADYRELAVGECMDAPDRAPNLAPIPAPNPAPAHQPALEGTRP